MATEIPLHPRTELPPTRVGEVKPPLALAEGAELAQLGQAGAKFAGGIFNQLAQAKAANEEATFQGEVNTAMGQFSTFVAANPAASFNELEQERDRMMTRLELAGQSATTGTARQNNANMLARNKGSIYFQTQTSMEGIRSRQELATYNELQQNNVNSFNRDAYIELKDKAVASNMQNKEFADAQQVQDFAIIDKAESKIVVDNASDLAFGVWQQTGDLNAAFDAIAAMPITGEEKVRAENSVKSRVTNRRAEQQIQLEEQREQDYDGISKLIFTEKNYDAAMKAVEASSLDEKTQASLLADIDRRATAAAKGVPLTNDRVEEHRLYELSLDIWRNAVTKPEFDADLAENQHKLDDNAFSRVATSAANTLKSSQAEALTRADKEITRSIVDFASESAIDKFISETAAAMKGAGAAPDAIDLFKDTTNETRQLQFWAVSRYNAELRQWIEDNPDKLGKDFFQFSESLKAEYRSRNLEDLELLRQLRETDLLIGDLPEIPGGIPSISAGDTDAYGKLPSGTRYRDAQGNIAVKR